jgi:hypothetical protein
MQALASVLIAMAALTAVASRTCAEQPAAAVADGKRPEESLQPSSQPSLPPVDSLVDYSPRNRESVRPWRAVHDVESVTSEAEGMRIRISGPDPYIFGPAADFPNGEPLLLRMRLKSATGGIAQVFYFDRVTTEDKSVRFPVPAQVWHDVAVPLPPLGPQYRLRFDPPGQQGDCMISALSIGRPVQAKIPLAPSPTPFVAAELDERLTSGKVELRHASRRWNDFSLSASNRLLAVGHNRLQVGYWRQGKTHWLPLHASPANPQEPSSSAEVTTQRQGEELTVAANYTDAHGGKWHFRRVFSPHPRGGFQIETQVTVNQTRQIVFLPSLVLLAGLGADGKRKSQALLAGVEYLEDEPSSSEADIEGAAALRRTPANHKVTFPLMAWQHAGNYLAVAWKREQQIAPLFDSPDRVWSTEAHVMGLIGPGAQPTYRGDGEPLVHTPWTLAANQPHVSHAEVWGGAGNSVVSAVSEYVARRGLPETPAQPVLQDYVRLAAAGWLDSPLREGDRYRHAVGNNFVPQPAYDVAWMLEQLARLTDDDALRARCRQASLGAASVVAEGTEYFSHVGHLQQPAGGLIFGKYEITRQQALAQFRDLLNSFDADGIARYRPPAQGIDYSRTHGSREANGFAALAALRLLQNAAYGGGRQQVDQALEYLKKLDRYTGQTPRGAQTWEIALHTPDILASAHLVKAYTLAFRLTGDPTYLERARYWAWTGVPFVYLDNPTQQPVGPYSTTAVLGATQWKAPVWIGLPVQWCGLVYAEGLYRLAAHDSQGPWKQLADGIVVSAIQQTYPAGEQRQGLLPDSYDLVQQARNPADINPGTLQPLAVEFFTGIPAYEVQGWRSGDRQCWVCAPGKASEFQSETKDDRIVDSFVASPWAAGRSTLVVHGYTTPPQVRINDQPIDEASLRFLEPDGPLLITLPHQRPTRIELTRRR